MPPWLCIANCFYPQLCLIVPWQVCEKKIKKQPRISESSQTNQPTYNQEEELRCPQTGHSRCRMDCLA